MLSSCTPNREWCTTQFQPPMEWIAREYIKHPKVFQGTFMQTIIYQSPAALVSTDMLQKVKFSFLGAKSLYMI